MTKYSLGIVICAILLLCLSGANAVTFVKVNGQSSGTIDASVPFILTMDCTPGGEVLVAIVEDTNKNGYFDPDTDKALSASLSVDNSWTDEDTQSGSFKRTFSINLYTLIDQQLFVVATEVGGTSYAFCPVVFHYPTTSQGVRGKVTNNDGTPAVGVAVGATTTQNIDPYSLDHLYPLSCTRTDSSGNYTVYLPSGGNYVIWAASTSASLPKEVFPAPVYVAQSSFVNDTNFPLSAPEPAPPPLPLYTVNGMVRDNSGHPLPFVDVVFDDVTETHTDLNGRYSVRLTVDTHEIFAQLNGYSMTGPFSVEVTGNTTLDINMYRTPYTLQGVVTEVGTATAIPGVEINLADANSINDTTDTTSPSGKFLVWVNSSDYEISASKPGTSLYSQYSADVTVTHNQGYNFSLYRATAKLMGTITDGNGSPLPWVQIGANWVYDGVATTGPDGKYSIAVFPYAGYDFAFSKPGYAGQEKLGVDFRSNQTQTYDAQMPFYSHPPRLSGGKVTPAYGNENTDFTFEVTYSDPDNDPPGYLLLARDDGNSNLTKVDPSDNNYVDGVKYSVTTKLGTGDHFYQFVFMDSHNIGAIPVVGERRYHDGPYVHEFWNPTNDSLTPSSGIVAAGQKYTFTSKYTDNDGVSDISYCDLLLNTTMGVSSNSIYLMYNNVTNRLYLRNDANSAWLGGFAPGSANVIENNQCKVYCAESSKSISGNQLAMSWKVELKPSQNGKTLLEWLFAADKEGHATVWSRLGTIRVAQPPVDVSLTPNSGAVGSGVKTLFTTKYSDPAGYANLSGCYFLLNTTTGVSANSVYLFYNPVQNKLYLRNDAGTALTGGFAPGSASVLENSQCKVYCAETTVQTSGTQMTVNWKVELKPSQNGKTLLEWMFVTNKSGLTDGWDKMGAVEIAQPPVDVSLSPNSGSITVGTKQTFICQYSDPNGSSDIAYAFLLLNKAVGSGANSAYVVYNQKVNLLYLKNDANTGWLGGFAPGTVNTIENSQCKVYCAETTVSGSGNNLTVNWKIQPKSAMAGSTWMEWLMVTDKSNLSDGWDKFGTVAVQ